MLPQSISGQPMSGRHLAGQASAHRVAPALFAILLGLGLVLVVGFAPVAEMHNAAHDTRHSAAFPCH